MRGIDWGSQQHAVCVVESDGKVLMQFTVPHTAAGLAELVARLARCGPPEQLRVGIERPSGLLVDTLVAAGHPVVPIHPNAIKASRPRYRAAGGKQRPQRCLHRGRRPAHRRPSLSLAASTV